MRKQKGAITTGLILLLAVVAALAVVGMSLYGYAVSINNQAVAYETRLSTEYRSVQVEVSNYVSTFYEQTGLAKAKSEKMDNIIRGAIEGRFGDDPKQGQALLNAVSEAYPDTKGLDIYDKILPTVAAGREGIRNKQNQLLDEARSYDSWRKQGVFRRYVLSGVYPSKDLSIKVGDRMIYAQEALDHLKEPVVTSSTSTAFETGKMEPLKVE